jgi:ATP-binding cassette subfamily B protein
MTHPDNDVVLARSKTSAPSLWWRALEITRAKRSSVGVILTLTLFVGTLGALEPLLLKYLLDGLRPFASAEAFWRLLVALLVLGVVREACAALTNWLTWRTRIDFQFQLLDATVDRLHSLPLSYHRAHDVGGIMTRLDRGIQGVVSGLSELAFNVLPATVYLLVSILIMVRLDARATLLVIAFMPIPAVITALTAPEQVEREKLLMGRWSSIYARFNEVLSGIVTVKSFAMEEQEKRRFLGGVQTANDDVVRGVFRDSWVDALRNISVWLARITALGWGGYLILRGQSSVGTVVAFLAYVAGLFGPFQGLLGTYRTLQKTRAALEAVFGILDAQDSLGDEPGAKEIAKLSGDVRFENVWFGFERQRMVLRGINLTAHAGQMVAIVGPSGSGKTTMMTLLQRLYDPVQGSIFVDGIDLKHVRQRSLREQIGVVLQDGLIFNDTVRANIAYGAADASPARVLEAARAAHAHEFIERLSLGYETIVGERGSHLSVGQRQRLAIARAVLKDPPILVLDEATSALDAESEELVQEALAQLVRDRTTFVIAHRLSTVMHADCILVLKNGQILEQGTHATLMAAQGYYATLVEKQLRGFAGRRSAEAASARGRAS